MSGLYGGEKDMTLLDKLLNRKLMAHIRSGCACRSKLYDCNVLCSSCQKVR